MSRVFIGDYPFNGTFEAGIAGPIDARYVVEEYSDLMSEVTWPSGIEDKFIYEGMQVYVRAEKKVYILVDAKNYGSASSWKELASDVEDTSIEIADNLHSTRTDAALSANQGRVLDEKITSLEDKIFDGEKIDTSLLPEFNTGLFYGGTIDKSGVCTLTSKLKEILGLDKETTQKHITSLNVNDCSDVYFIASEAGESIKVNTDVTVPTRSAGDWIISDGTNWNLVASNAVASVVGKTGAITAKDIVESIKYTNGSNPALSMPTYDVINAINGNITTIKARLNDDISPRIDDVNTALTWQTL